MEILANEIRKNGFIYTLHKKGEKAYIYQQYCPEIERVMGWEVFQIKVDKPKVVFGVELGEREIFPGNEDFGKWAWSYSSYDKASEKFIHVENGKVENKEEFD